MKSSNHNLDRFISPEAYWILSLRDINSISLLTQDKFFNNNCAEENDSLKPTAMVPSRNANLSSLLFTSTAMLPIKPRLVPTKWDSLGTKIVVKLPQLEQLGRIQQKGQFLPMIDWNGISYESQSRWTEASWLLHRRKASNRPTDGSWPFLSMPMHHLCWH